MTEQEDDHELRILGLDSFSKKTVDIYGLTVPAAFNVTLFKSKEPSSVTMLVVVDPEHGPLPKGIIVNAAPRTKSTYKDALKLLKGAPIDALIHQALLDAALSLRWDSGIFADGPKSLQDLTDEDRVRAAEGVKKLEPQIEAAARPPVRRRTVTKKLLEDVARVYRSAFEEGRPPTQAVADHFEITHASAARWVREARKAGILGPSVGPTAGEATTALE